MRAILLTSTFLRHRFVANRVAERFDLAGVWLEDKSFEPLRYADNGEDERVIVEHFAARDASEEAWFGEHQRLQCAEGRVHHVERGGCNALDAIAAMRAASPDVVLVFGTGILKSDLIDAFAGRIINLHLGLSPYYRGAGTNFWPLVNGEPEYVGATIHYLDAGIDTGPMIAHVRPEIRAGDGPHDVGNRAIEAAAGRLVDAALAHVAGRLRPLSQTGPGRLYRRNDFSAAAVRRLYENFASGMIPEYLEHKAERDRCLRLIDLPESV